MKRQDNEDFTIGLVVSITVLAVFIIVVLFVEAGLPEIWKILLGR